MLLDPTLALDSATRNCTCSNTDNIILTHSITEYSFSGHKTHASQLTDISKQENPKELSAVSEFLKPSLHFRSLPKMNGFVEELAKKAISAGPWGGQDGMLFDDGVNSAVRQVVINHGTAIDSIQTEYDQNGASYWANKHGGRGGYKTDTVKLGYPDEYLTSINGYYGKLNEWGPQLVRSLTLKSNKRTYGPFGVEEGTAFSFPMTGVKIVGFHGVAGWFLDAIGVHLKPIEKKQSDQSRPLYHAQNYALNTASETTLNGFSVIQGSLGQSYDIVLAVRQRSDDFSAKENTKPLPSKISKQFSLSGSEASSDTDQESSKVGNKASINKIKPRANNAPSMVEGAIKWGPWGGTGGSVFDDGSYNGIKQINVSRNIEIVYIRVLYDRNGESVWGARLGGTGGFRTEKVIFDYPNEVLTHITGTFSPAMKMGPNVIKSLTFHTTKGKHGPLGDEQGTPFTTKEKEGKIVGFHGRRGLFLDALGVHVLEGKFGGIVSSTATPKSDSSNLKALVVPASSGHDHHQQKQLTVVSEVDHAHWPPNNRFAITKAGPSPKEAVAFGVVKEPSPCGAGPWGGEGGRSWDDGVFSGIKQIYLTRSDEAVCSAQIEYDRNGQSVWSVKHGGNSGNTCHRIKLEFPNEVLSCVCGYHNGKVIRSLTFYTSRGKYGPYGEEIGTFFTSTTTEGKVVGFHGRSSLYLDAMGVHMQHWLGNQRHSKPSRFKMF